jgi:hypothetical protein
MLDAQTKGIDTSKAGCQEKKSENNEVEGVRQNNSETSRNVKENEGCTPDRKKHQEQSILDCWIEDSVKWNLRCLRGVFPQKLIRRERRFIEIGFGLRCCRDCFGFWQY